jgi:hypothetical protein
MEEIQAKPLAALSDRREERAKPSAFMQLPLEQRRRILAAQAEAMVEHYEQDTEWRKFQGGDIIEY